MATKLALDEEDALRIGGKATKEDTVSTAIASGSSRTPDCG